MDVRRLVYLTAFVPQKGMSLREQWRAHPEMFVTGGDRGIARGTGRATWWADLTAAADVLMQDCPAEAKTRAAARLRPQQWQVADARFDARRRTASTHVIADDDRLLNAAWLADQAHHDLDHAPRRLPGGHCPMLSRPSELADLLACVHADAPRC